MVNGKQVVESKSVEVKTEVTVETIENEIEPETNVSIIYESIRDETIALQEISESEKNLLAKCVMAEAGNQGEKGQRLVTACILNRVDNEDFPNSITEVITQQGQFSSYPKAMNKCKPTEEVYCSIEKEIVERSNTEVLYFRTEHYHDGKEDLFIEGNHYFSK